MLKGIPAILPPELLKLLMEMGHGDELVIGDGNFPGASHAQRLVRCDGHGVPELLDAVLALMPLDSYVERPVTLMKVAESGSVVPAIWDTYRRILRKHGEKDDFEQVERFAFYERAQKAYAVVMTGEKALYANLILRKGVVNA